MPKDKFTATYGEIRMLMGDPIETASYSLKDRESLMTKVRETISKNFKLLSEQQNGDNP
jgi:hypothetical protein